MRTLALYVACAKMDARTPPGLCRASAKSEPHVARDAKSCGEKCAAAKMIDESAIARTSERVRARMSSHKNPRKKSSSRNGATTHEAATEHAVAKGSSALSMRLDESTLEST